MRILIFTSNLTKLHNSLNKLQVLTPKLFLIRQKKNIFENNALFCPCILNIHIKRQKQGLNKQKDTESLPESYLQIIQSLSYLNSSFSLSFLLRLLPHFYPLLLFTSHYFPTIFFFLPWMFNLWFHYVS